VALRRAFKLTYGSYVAGYGQDRRHLDGFVRVAALGPDALVVSFSVVLTAAAPGSADDLEDEIVAFRAAFDEPNARLLVECIDPSDGTTDYTYLDLKPTTTGRTAIEIRPSYETGEPGLSSRSHVFDVRILAGKLASYDASHVRDEGFRYEISTSDTRIRTLRISGTATATASAGALVTAQAAWLTLRATIVASVGGSWPTVPRSERVTPDKEDHVCEFAVEFRERVVNEAVGTLDHASIVDQQLGVGVQPNAGELASAEDRPLDRVTAAGRYAIDADVTTDLADVWESIVQPHMEAVMADLVGSEIYVIEAQPGYDVEGNALNPRMAAVADGGGRQLQHAVVEVIGQQLLRGAAGNDVTMVHDRDVVAEQVSLLHIMRGQHHGLAAGLDRLHQIPEIAPRLRIEAGGRLVEEQQVGIVDQGDRQQHALALAAGQLAVIAVEELFQVAGLDQLLDRRAVVVQRVEEAEVLAHGQEILQRGVLELDADPLAVVRVQRAAAVADFARRGPHQPFEHFHGGALAGTVGPEQAQAAALLDVEADAIDGLHARIVFAQIAHSEYGGHDRYRSGWAPAATGCGRA